MVLTNQIFLSPFLMAFFISLLVTPLAIKLAWKLNLVDFPKKKAKETHTYPVPRGGGLPIIVALLATSLFFLPLDKHLTGILAASLFATFIGLLDDRFDLNPYFRLFTCLGAAGIVVTAGIGIAFITNPFDGLLFLDQPRLNFYLLGQNREIWILSSLFGLLWITWCMNFIGWSGGVEGQFPGFVGIAAVTIAALSLRFSADITQWPVIILAATVAGAYFGFLPFNFYPQKIMPGYSGKSLGGLLLGILSLLSTAKIGTLLVVAGIPFIDASYLIVKRILSGRSPFWGGREHLHHRLLDLGWSKPKVAIFYWIVTAIFGFLALNLNSQQKFYTMVAIATIFVAFSLWLKNFTTSSSRSDQNNG